MTVPFDLRKVEWQVMGQGPTVPDKILVSICPTGKVMGDLNVEAPVSWILVSAD
jgi:hypothetical protein